MFGSLNSPYLITFSVTGFVSPLIVRSPVRRKRSSPDFSTLVLLKVIVGYLSTSRKLDDRRSLSRCSLWVRMLAVLMLTSMFERSGSSGRTSPVTETSAKWPRTVIIPRCLAENSTWVWYGSNFQTPMGTPPLVNEGGARVPAHLPTNLTLQLFVPQWVWSLHR